MTMRVAMLGLYPRRPDFVLGGEESVVAMLSQALSRDPQLDVQVVTFSPGDQDSATRQPETGPTVHRLSQPRFGRLTWHLPAARRLKRALDSLQPDVVHAHGSLVYAAAAVRSGYPSLVTVHGIMAREANTVEERRRRAARLLDAWYERYALRPVHDLIAISPYVQTAYRWLTPARVHRIDNPVDDRYFGVVRQAEPLRILCPVRVIPRKGLLFALQATAVLAQQHPTLQLRVAGEMMAMPTHYAACRAFVSDHGLDGRVHFLDNLDRDRLVEEYARCTLMLLPSMQETAPVVIGEAQAAGVPVVATRVGGVPAMIEDGVTGRLVDYDDVDGLVAALADLLSDPGAREEMAQRGQEHAETHYRVAQVAARTKEVYGEIVRFS